MAYGTPWPGLALTDSLRGVCVRVCISHCVCSFQGAKEVVSSSSDGDFESKRRSGKVSLHIVMWLGGSPDVTLLLSR